MEFFKINNNEIFASAQKENSYDLLSRLESLRSELLELATKEADIAPATLIVDALYDYVIPLVENGECNRSSYWEKKGVDTGPLPLQEVLDYVHSAYYGVYDNCDIDEYRSAYMAVYEVLTSYTDLFVGRDWLDTIWKDRTLAA